MHNRLWTGMALLMSLAGCQSARYVVREADHGVVAIPADSPKYLGEAEELMREHFPDGYRIVREEAVAVEDAPGEGHATASAAAPSATRADSAPRRGDGPRAEWRITYFRTQPPAPSSAAVAASDASPPPTTGESLFSTAGIVEPASNSN